MNFSDSFSTNNRLCSFSPDGTYLAHVDGHYKLFVRSSKTLNIIHTFTCVDEISNILWSYNSSMVLCAMCKRAVVQLFSVDNPDWTCKIDEGSYGLTSVYWSADDQSVLTTSEFNLRITVWSLVNKSVSYIKYPKAANPGLDFSGDSQFMALAERRDFNDFVSVFTVKNWSLTSHFQVNTTDLQGIRWAPDNVTLAVLETCTEVKLLFYSILGHLLSSIEPYQNSLGLKTLAFSPTGQFAAAGFYNQSIHIIPHIVWKSIAKFSHPKQLSSETKDAKCMNDCCADATVYKEVDFKMQTLSSSSIVNLQPSGPLKVKQVRYEIIKERPFDIPFTSPDPEKPNPKLGPGLLAFSSNGMYLMSRNDNQPCTLYIWNMKKLKLESVLQQSEPITAAQWDPMHCRLALVTGTPKVFLWTPDGCVAVKIVEKDGSSFPGGLDIKWHPEGEKFAVLGKHSFFLCYLSNSS